MACSRKRFGRFLGGSVALRQREQRQSLRSADVPDAYLRSASHTMAPTATSNIRLLCAPDAPALLVIASACDAGEPPTTKAPVLKPDAIPP